MAAEGVLSFSVASVVEDVLQQHGTPSRYLDLDSRKAEETASRRNDAAGWLRKMIGVVAAKDLPAQPSEEEFRLGLRSGIILCNALNKVQPDVVTKIVESPYDASSIRDGAAFQYFENVRNFLVAIQELSLPTFEASDLEQGGRSARVVNCVLALKSYSEWKQSGGKGVWKFGGNVKSATLEKSFVRKNSEPFTNFLSKSSSLNEKCLNAQSSEFNSNTRPSSSSMSILVRSVLSNKKPEEVHMLVESMLNKVVEEFEHRIINQSGLLEPVVSNCRKPSVSDKKTEAKSFNLNKKESSNHEKQILEEQMKSRLVKQQIIFDRQQKDVEELRRTLHMTKAGMQFMQNKFLEEFSSIGTHIHGLAHATSGYHRVIEENRKLYNEVQDLKGSIRVYCRVRPFFPGQASNLSSIESMEDGIITITTPSRHGKGHKSFNFNKVFGSSATQAEVFSDMQPLIRSVLDGYNVCIFAYGQTGSGKTFTMSGPKELTEKSQGVNYRALGDLFFIAEQRKDTFRYNIAVQMIEIYNEQVRDLLDGSNKRLEIRNSSQTGLSVPDARLVPVSSTYDVIDLMQLGHKNRAVGATALNDRSSRSHSCLTVHVQGRNSTSGATLRGCMHLVDLAGSERVDKSEVTGDRLKEAQHINKSLSALGDVIASLAQKNPHVPYRNSKLTQLLQDSLGGQAKTLMFVHISPEANALSETISTLKFAERVATVELGAARVNKDGNDVKELKEQIANLKAALARKEGEKEQSNKLISGSSERYRTKAPELSPFSSYKQVRNMLLADDNNSSIENVEVHTSPALNQKMQNFDPDEILVNSPPWPPVISPVQDNQEDGKELSSGDWVDKVMVNKQDINRSCWENGTLPDDFYQKYLPDSSRIFSEQSYNVFMGNNNESSVASTDDSLDLDAATSDWSEPDVPWNLNQPKLTSLSNSIGSKNKKTVPKSTKIPQMRNLSPLSGPSPSKKQTNGVSARTGRQPVSADYTKRKAGNRK